MAAEHKASTPGKDPPALFARDHPDVGDLETKLREDADPASASEREEIDHGAVNEKALLRKIDWRLLPAVGILYLLSFLDRSNVGNARIEGLADDLGMTGNQYLTGLTLYFIGYVLFEVRPPNSTPIAILLCCALVPNPLRNIPDTMQHHSQADHPSVLASVLDGRVGCRLDIDGHRPEPIGLLRRPLFPWRRRVWTLSWCCVLLLNVV